MVNCIRHGITRTAVVAALGGAVLAAGGIIVFLKPSLWTDIQLMVMPSLPPHVEEVVQRTDAQAEAEIDRHLALLRGVFEEAHGRVPSFVDRVLGIGGKVFYLTHSEAEFKQAVLNTFQEEVISQEDIEHAIQQILQSYVASLNDLDSQLLVELMADMPDPSRSGIGGAFVSQDIVEKTIGAIPSPLTDTLPKAIASDVASLILGELATQIATRVLVSAGVLGEGAASSTVTFGVGLVAAFVVDSIVEQVSGIRPYITETCDQQLDMLYLQIAEGRKPDGTKTGRGLRELLEQYHQERMKARRLMVHQCLKQ